MVSRSIVLLVVCVAAVALGGSARADASDATCYGRHSLGRTEPLRIQKWSGQGSYSALVGARVFFWADPGLTGEWLHYQLARRVAEPRPESDCPLDVPGAQVRVTSAGPGFWVAISAREGSRANEVLRRALAQGRQRAPIAH